MSFEDFWYFDVGAGWTILLIVHFIISTIMTFKDRTDKKNNESKR